MGRFSESADVRPTVDETFAYITDQSRVIGLDTTMSFTVEPSGPGSQVTMMANVTGRGLRRLLAPVVTNEMRKSTVRALAALQQHLGVP